jgi:protease I
MATIAIIITDMFEDSEYSKPAEAFKQAGHRVVHVGLKKGRPSRASSTERRCS